MPAINLMSPQAKRHQCIRTRASQWGRVLLILLALLGIVTGERYLAYRRAVQDQLLLEAAYEPIVELKSANRLLSQQIAAIRNEEQFVLALSEQEPTITILGLVGNAVADGQDRLFLQKIELNNIGLATDPPAEKQTIVDLAGIAESTVAINELADTLRGTVSFGTVDVMSTKQFRIKQQSMHDFSVQCRY